MATAPSSFQRYIRSDVKTNKHLDHWREAENPVRYAFAKLLRERDNTKKIYDVDPYAEVYTLRENIYGIWTESLTGGGDPWMFLIVGPEKAMLIDTAYGIGDTKGLVHELIGDMPYYVVNTHAHGDHAGGNFQFETVYCHEYEVPGLKAMMNEHCFDRYFNPDGSCAMTDFDRNDLVEIKDYNIIGLPDGYVFNLGADYDVELVFLPGHSVGHCGFLDKKSRIFFPGDDCCVGVIGVGGKPAGTPYREFGTVEALYNEFVKICARVDEFDSLFPSHGPVETGPVMLFSAMEACKKVLDDPGCYDMAEEGPRGKTYNKQIHESGYLRYSSSSVYMNRVAEID